MNLHEAIEQVDEVVADVISDMDEIRSTKCGLDSRAGYRLYINEDAIAVDKSNDNILQYYGGFEYVDKMYRKELGDYVFYLRDDSRVDGHIEYWEDMKED